MKGYRDEAKSERAGREVSPAAVAVWEGDAKSPAGLDDSRATTRSGVKLCTAGVRSGLKLDRFAVIADRGEHVQEVPELIVNAA